MSTTNENGLLYTGWTKPRNSGLFGLTWGTTIVCFVLVIAVMVAMLAGGFKVGLTVLAVSVVVAAPLVWGRDGRSGYEMTVLRMQWLRTRRRRENIYRGGLFSEMPGGKALLPGVVADTKLYEGEDAAGYRFGMIHMPKLDLYTVVLKAWPQGDEAVDQSMINEWVGEWGVVLASMGQTSDVVSVVPVIDCVPETGNRLLAEVIRQTEPDAPQLAQDSNYEAAELFATEQAQLLPRLAVTFRATTDARKKDPSEQAVEIGRRLPGLCAAMRSAGVGVRPMAASDVISFVRRSTDPASQEDIERADATVEGHGLDWSDAGPISHEERFDQYIHDGARSVTWEMEMAPTGAVDEGVLRRILAPNPDIPRKRVAIVYRPHTAADAVKIVDNDYKNALIAEQGGKGIGSVTATLKVEATARAREEQARGHGLVRFGILITITEPLDGDIPAIDAIIKDLSVQARLKVRRAYRYQAAGFYGSLGIGVILPEHASMPSAMAG
ncbi:hypothetical protein AC1659_28970 [Rhodococcus erythropolis]|uniref:SCO6880 family protein n=1 Tax=Rhodococcus erythropolis TaxID=1833 RepID=UPI001BA9A0DC|nr:SCO6880 family protein [Rhodococcus erythropolis]MBS2993335.1 hypothetical protein [Rhodococcus erythropolis]